MNCIGCQDEMAMCYEYQSKGYDAGLDWIHGCCFVFAFNERGELILW